MKRVQSIVLMTTSLALIACQEEAPASPSAADENTFEEAVETQETSATQSAQANIAAAQADPSDMDAAPSSETMENGSNPPAPQKPPAGSKLQRAD